MQFDGAAVPLRIETGNGLAVFRLMTPAPKTGVTRLRRFRLGVPTDAKIAGSVNAAVAVGNLAAAPNVEPNPRQTDVSRGDRDLE